MIPTWSADGLELYKGDCAEILPTLAPKVQLIVTSPPYNVQRDYGDGASQDRLAIKDYLRLLRLWLRGMAAVLRPGGVLALNLPFGIALSDPKPGRFEKARGFKRRNTFDRRTMQGIHQEWTTFSTGAWAEMAVLGAGLLPRRGITWVKSPKDGEAYATTLAMGNVANPFFRPASERIILASKGQYAREGTGGRVHSRERIDWLKDVWHISAYQRGTGSQRPWDAGGHPCPFPLELPRRLILLFSEPGDLICDPFVGSGTTGEAARMLGRRFIGIDTNPDYLNYAKYRIQMGVKAAGQFVAAERSGAKQATLWEES